jgi:dUTPase
LIKIITPDIEEVKELDETTRGENGFGSTGMK